MKEEQIGYHQRTFYNYFAFLILALLFLKLLEYFKALTYSHLMFIVVAIYIANRYFINIQIKKHSLVVSRFFSHKEVILFDWIEEVEVKKILWRHYLTLKLKKSTYYLPLNLKDIDSFWDDLINIPSDDNNLTRFAKQQNN